jgi:hypothetical protein
MPKHTEMTTHESGIQERETLRSAEAVPFTATTIPAPYGLVQVQGDDTSGLGLQPLSADILDLLYTLEAEESLRAQNDSYLVPRHESGIRVRTGTPSMAA